MTKELVKKMLTIGAALLVGFILAKLPPFGAMQQVGMIYLGIFVGFLIVLVSGAVPDWLAGLAAMCLFTVFGVGTVAQVFAPFAQSTMWLIIGIFTFAAAIGNSGLMNRLALNVLSIFPSNYRGQVLALMATGFVMSPLIPSTNAKVNMLIPMATAVTEQVGFKERSRGALGLFSATFMPCYVGANAFFSGGVAVAIMLGFLTDELKGQLTWVGWLSATCVWLAAILVGTYIFCMTYCKPKENTELPPGFIAQKLKDLGPMTSKEKITSFVLLAALAAWITQPMTGLDAGMVALLAALTLGVFDILTTRDMVTQVPWTLILFIGSLLSIAAFMPQTGVSTWLASILGPFMAPLVKSVWILVPCIIIVVYILRFAIISQMATFTILYAILTPLLEGTGISVFVPVFAIYISTNIWNVKYQNPFPLATIAIAGGKYVTFEEFRKTSYAYMIMNIIGMTISIPLWQMLGLC